MRKYIWHITISLCALTGVILSCKKPYNPPVISNDQSYLVVEGVINSGNDSTFIKLSKTVNIAGKTSSTFESGALVTVEAEQGGSYTLQPGAYGSYFSGALNLDASKKYRLHIVTAGNKEYVSDYEPVKPTPPIDSVGFKIKNDELQIYANAHDAANNTRYYRWDYTEAWRFHAKFQSGYLYDKINVILRVRRPDEQIYYCFQADTSANIVLGSSSKLAQDVIAQQEIVALPSYSEKVELRYSIQLRQYAFTKEAYQFWENLRKNTEQLGSIFDAQPTQLTGNIHCVTNPAEPVIGYVSITNPQLKRIFIDRAQLPQKWVEKYPYDCGEPDSALFVNKQGIDEVRQHIVIGGALAIYEIVKNSVVLGFTYSYPECADCTIRGKVKQPSFWVEGK